MSQKPEPMIMDHWEYISFLSHYANKFGVVEAILIEDIKNTLTSRMKNGSFDPIPKKDGRHFLLSYEPVFMDFFMPDHLWKKAIAKLVKSGFLIRERFDFEYPDGRKYFKNGIAFKSQKEVLGIKVEK